MTNLTRAASAAVREALRSRGLRQQDVASVLGLSQASVSDRLTGKTPFTLKDLERIAEHLGIPVAELLEPPATLVDDAQAAAS
jgi:transcriptional regulator with XRE-family HTH domain